MDQNFLRRTWEIRRVDSPGGGKDGWNVGGLTSYTHLKLGSVRPSITITPCPRCIVSVTPNIGSLDPVEGIFVVNSKCDLGVVRILRPDDDKGKSFNSQFLRFFDRRPVYQRLSTLVPSLFPSYRGLKRGIKVDEMFSTPRYCADPGVPDRGHKRLSPVSCVKNSLCVMCRSTRWRLTGCGYRA